MIDDSPFQSASGLKVKVFPQLEHLYFVEAQLQSKVNHHQHTPSSEIVAMASSSIEISPICIISGASLTARIETNTVSVTDSRIGFEASHTWLLLH